RRFTQKIKLSKPLFEERKKLWNLFIPEKLPLASDVNIDELAIKYLFSGSQIKTVILNAATDVASRNEDYHVISQDDFINFADIENNGSFDEPPKNKIGFTS
ncbi:MAG: AAA family ATPase, partial [Bacteroidota bacterium]|nr:AAA family ATPase [Bacteroidota bacterium]